MTADEKLKWILRNYHISASSKSEMEKQFLVGIRI